MAQILKNPGIVKILFNKSKINESFINFTFSSPKLAQVSYDFEIPLEKVLVNENDYKYFESALNQINSSYPKYLTYDLFKTQPYIPKDKYKKWIETKIEESSFKTEDILDGMFDSYDNNRNLMKTYRKIIFETLKTNIIFENEAQGNKYNGLASLYKFDELTELNDKFFKLGICSNYKFGDSWFKENFDQIHDYLLENKWARECVLKFYGKFGRINSLYRLKKYREFIDKTPSFRITSIYIGDKKTAWKKYSTPFIKNSKARRLKAGFQFYGSVVNTQEFINFEKKEKSKLPHFFLEKTTPLVIENKNVIPIFPKKFVEKSYANSLGFFGNPTTHMKSITSNMDDFIENNYKHILRLSHKILSNKEDQIRGHMNKTIRNFSNIFLKTVTFVIKKENNCPRYWRNYTAKVMKLFYELYR